MDKYKMLCNDGKEAYLQALTETGWFNQPQNIKEEIESRFMFAKHNNFVLHLYHLWFDTEGFEDDDAYRDLLDQIIKVAGLQNTTSSVSYNSEEHTVDIIIKIANNIYQYSVILENFGDWVDDNFIDEFINNEMLKGENIESRFFSLPPTDQSIQYIFIPEKLYHNAVDKGIIPGEPDYFMKDYL